MSLQDLKESLEKFKSEYRSLKMLHAVTPLESPMRIRQLRKTVARLATEITVKSK